MLNADAFGPNYLRVLSSLQPPLQSPLLLLSDTLDEAGQIAGLELGATDIAMKSASARLIVAQSLVEVRSSLPPEPQAKIRIGSLVLTNGKCLAIDVVVTVVNKRLAILLRGTTSAVARSTRWPRNWVGIVGLDAASAQRAPHGYQRSAW